MILSALWVKWNEMQGFRPLLYLVKLNQALQAIWCPLWIFSRNPAALVVYYKADSRFTPSQWETLQSNTVSHRLGANLESAMYYMKSESHLQGLTMLPVWGRSHPLVQAWGWLSLVDETLGQLCSWGQWLCDVWRVPLVAEIDNGYLMFEESSSGWNIDWCHKGHKVFMIFTKSPSCSQSEAWCQHSLKLFVHLWPHCTVWQPILGRSAWCIWIWIWKHRD